ncbi:tetratricopeptide repeat protein [Pseudomonas sp. Leaf129]|uniref:tetratricopeptide repeat protein n=1 Tax=Pseudomonas sp. Leaf129 TaxID=1736268 RepID=UPI000A4A1526|nr:tetratricopeptide repeat protein [Pseudomonas sp. Leaf129]
MNEQTTREITGPRSIGYFDYVEDGYAYGWAYDKENLTDRPVVEIYSGDFLVGRGVADEFRQDLLEAQLGDGRYSFKIALSYELNDGNTHNLTVCAGRNGYVLTGSPRTFGPVSDKSEFSFINRLQGVEIFQQELTRNQIHVSAAKKDALLQVYALASLLQETESLAESKHAWTSLIKATSKSALLMCKKAEVSVLEEDFKQAIRHYLDAIEEDLTFVFAHLGLARCYEILADFTKAKDAYEIAHAIAPDDKLVQSRLANLQNKMYPQLAALTCISDLLVPYTGYSSSTNKKTTYEKTTSARAKDTKALWNKAGEVDIKQIHEIIERLSGALDAFELFSKRAAKSESKKKLVKK